MFRIVNIELNVTDFVLTRTDSVTLLDYQSQEVGVIITSDIPVEAIQFNKDDTWYVKSVIDNYCVLPHDLLFEEYFYCKVIFSDANSNAITIPVTRIVPPPSPDPQPADVFEQIFTSLATKYDNVVLDGNTLKFYADNVLKKSIEITQGSVDWEDILNKPDEFEPKQSSLETYAIDLAREINKL